MARLDGRRAPPDQRRPQPASTTYSGLWSSTVSTVFIEASITTIGDCWIFRATSTQWVVKASRTKLCYQRWHPEEVRRGPSLRVHSK